jgi:hypothetical protein
MGATFQTRVLPGNLSQAEVEAKFAEIQDQDRYENGHSYSGGIGMANGLEFRSNTFDNIALAQEWLDENAEKWEAALCVKAFKRPNEPVWVIGAICSS